MFFRKFAENTAKLHPSFFSLSMPAFNTSHTLPEEIQSPEKLRQLSPSRLPHYAQLLRNFLIQHVEHTGGHLGASLGVVELTLALHYHFKSPEELLFWDVGHQAYVHKILTGRASQFPTLRQWSGLAGFPERKESPHDAFGVGHASTALSAALGWAIGGRVLGEKRKAVAIVGDGAATGGQFYEALNQLGTHPAGEDVLLILNANGMSIEPNVGSLSRYFLELKSSEKETFFSSFNLQFFQEKNGHSTNAILNTLAEIKAAPAGSKVLLIHTEKGKGHPKATQSRQRVHAVTPPEILEKAEESSTFKRALAESLALRLKNDPKAVIISPAMLGGAGLEELEAAFPERVLDVGIAEPHALTLAASLAARGLHPFVHIYSTFLQRAVDQVIHDIALQNLPVTLLIDRAGLVGQDGATHQGAFDVSFLRAVPGLQLAAARDSQNLHRLLEFSHSAQHGPLAIRYAKTYTAPLNLENVSPVQPAEWLFSEAEALLIAHGQATQESLKAREILQGKVNLAVLDLIFLKPLSEEHLAEALATFDTIFIAEEVAEIGGMGEAIRAFAQKQGYKGKIYTRALPDEFIPHGSPETQRQHLGLDAQGLAAWIKNGVNA